jgi:hypothetical protein
LTKTWLRLGRFARKLAEALKSRGATLQLKSVGYQEEALQQMVLSN